jgi:hypothetical protein
VSTCGDPSFPFSESKLIRFVHMVFFISPLAQATCLPAGGFTRLRREYPPSGDPSGPVKGTKIQVDCIHRSPFSQAMHVRVNKSPPSLPTVVRSYRGRRWNWRERGRTIWRKICSGLTIFWKSSDLRYWVNATEPLRMAYSFRSE